ncbi:hypothetical protein EB796_013730 [Bugula neritina]|uniref:Uncharacterized protein n=1 Tax=Bugula neritina TaxID=10212 RepID=A0A7J7JNR0_BUGNE|nr:hypothetical protein EB796_013730 [Bugula neritina]
MAGSEQRSLDYSQVMTDVNKYIESIDDEEKRSHPFGVTNVLLNGLNGRKSRNTLDTGRSLTWICFFCLVLTICGIIIYLSAKSANKTKDENCKLYNICKPTTPKNMELLEPTIKTTQKTELIVNQIYNSTTYERVKRSWDLQVSKLIKRRSPAD